VQPGCTIELLPVPPGQLCQFQAPVTAALARVPQQVIRVSDPTFGLVLQTHRARIR
jgi:hypothetical protein